MTANKKNISTNAASGEGAPAKTASDKTAAPATNSGGFKRTLSVFDLAVYGLIFMVPIAPFSIFGNVFQASGGMPALCYLIALCAMIFTVLSFGVMINKFPSSGSIYYYLSQGMGKGLGFIAGWLMLLQYLITPDLMYIMAGTALNQYVPEVPVWVWCLLFLAFVTCVSLRGIKTTIIVDRVALVGEMIVLAIFIGFGIHYILSNPGSGAEFTTAAVFDPSSFDFGKLMGGVSICVLSFVGFGSVATLTDEAKDARRGPSRAMMITVLVLGVLFIGMCFVATCADPSGKVFANDPNNGFFLVAQLVGGPWLGILCAVAIAISLGVFTGLEGQTSVARILYSMGRGGSLPSALGKLSKKTNTPTVATLFVSALSLVMLVGLLPLGMSDVTQCSNFGALASYFLLNICVIWFYVVRQKDHMKLLRHLVFPLIGAVVIGAIFLSLDGIAHIVGFAWVAIGVIYYLVATRVLHKDVKVG